MDVPIRLSRDAAISPANLFLHRDTAIPAIALERVVRRLGGVDPRVEQRDMAGIAAGAGPQSSNKIAGLELVPGNAGRDFGQADGVQGSQAGGSDVQTHGDEARAVGAVRRALGVGVRGRLAVGDVAANPELAAGDDFATADGRVEAGGAGDAAFLVGGAGAVAGDERAAGAARAGHLAGARAGRRAAGGRGLGDAALDV